MNSYGIPFSKNTMSTGLTISWDKELGKDISQDLLASLWVLNIGSDTMAKKLKQLLDATTINNNWDIMCDNKVQLDTLKLLLKLHWANISSNKIQINLFNNMPGKDDKLWY
jgi:hypothetical protein